MDRKKRSKMLRNIVIGEVIALLLILDAVLVVKLDGLFTYESSEVVSKQTAKAVNTARSEEIEDVKMTSIVDEAVEAAKTVDSSLLLLVNKDNPIPDDYEVNKCTYKDSGKKVAKVIVDPLTEMLEDGEEEGLSFVICSAYRSNEYQQNLVDKDIKEYETDGMSYEEAYAKTIKSVQPAGYSEHATGLAVDIISSSNTSLDKTQEETEEFQWLQKNCYKYGFILRYPDGKTDITGIIYEPWHFRYVGVEVATYITKEDITFEEYIERITEE